MVYHAALPATPHLPRLLPLLALLASACSVHRLDIQQGNVITRESVEKLKTGMDKRQVRAVLGSPLIADPFHPRRWDYVYSLRRGGREVRHSHVVLFFDDQDRLARIEVRAAPLPEAVIRAGAGGGPP